MSKINLLKNATTLYSYRLNLSSYQHRSLYCLLSDKMSVSLRFHWADYVIFIVFICISLGIGVYHALTGGKQKTTGEFIMADRKLKIIPTILSMVMSYMSAIMIIGSTAEVYNYGLEHWFWYVPGGAIGSLLAERIVVPWIYPLQLVSVYEVRKQL